MGQLANSKQTAFQRQSCEPSMRYSVYSQREEYADTRKTEQHANSKRAFQRQGCEASIRYSVYNQKEEYIDAKMYNSSEGGMYFESKQHISPGSDIRIKLANYSPDIHGHEVSDGYRGEVMWCRKIYKNGTNHYGVGVRFMVNVCDKCGEKVSYSEIQRTDNFLFLCSYCYKQMETWAGGKVNECMEKYLIGNVL